MAKVMGISRGPDMRPPEVKAAADKIVIGYGALTGIPNFLCTECQQSGGVEIKHLAECSVGKILDAYRAKMRLS